MTKIGLLTFGNGNYGSALQCYSTINFLKENGFSCDYIIEKKDKNLMANVQRYLKLLSKTIIYPNFFKDKIENRKTINLAKNILDPISESKIDHFMKEYITSSEYTYSQLKKIARTKEYAYFITGSDQVWNPTIGFKKSYYLQFAPKNKRISFSPSFGVSEIPSYYKKEIKKYLNEIPYLSVREEEGKRIIKELTNRDAARLCDPVVLSSRSDWIKFSNDSKFSETEFIFVHFLNDINELAITKINEFSEKSNLKIITFAYHQESFNRLNNPVFLNGDPQDYVYLINHAKYVFTDSFHTTMFSIILNKDFFTFERSYLSSKSQQSRVVNLLKRYSLLDRLITSSDAIKDEKIDFSYANRINVREREVAIEYLNRALDCEGVD